MARNYIIHIGPHKTGTTAIQKTLHELSARVSAEGWIYPTVGFVEHAQHGVSAAFEGRPNWSPEQILSKLNGIDSDLILSSENFSLLTAEQVKNLVKGLRPGNYRVVYYVRNILTTIYSNWHEFVKHGSTLTFPEYLAKRCIAPFVYRDVNPEISLLAWADAVGRDSVDVYLYDKIEDCSRHFIDAYFPNIEIKSEGHIRSINAALDFITVEVLRKLDGYQQTVLRNSVYLERVKELRDIISESANDYTLNLSGIYGNAPFNVIERLLVRNWKDRILTPFEDGKLFQKRKIEWQYLSPDIWTKHKRAHAALEELLLALKREFGEPHVDKRVLTA